MRAIISVSDKTGAAEFAADLVKLGYELFSTGASWCTVASSPQPSSARPV